MTDFRKRAPILIVYVGLIGFVPAKVWAFQSGDMTPPPNADANWLESYQSEVERQVELLTAAYSLDSQQQAALRLEMQARLTQTKAFEDKELAELDALVRKMEATGGGEDSPESQAVQAQMMKIGQQLPLEESVMADWVDKQLVAGAPHAVEGRQRWEELRNFQGAQRVGTENEMKNEAGLGGQFADARSTNEATLIQPGGEPLPTGEKGERLLVPQGNKRVGQESFIPPNIAEGHDATTAKLLGVQEKPPPWRTHPPPVDEVGGEHFKGGEPALPTLEPVAVAPSMPQPPQQPGPIVVGNKPMEAPKPAQPVLQPAPPLDDWDKHVISVATKYKFDDPQITKAQSILRDLKRRANQYRLSRTDDFAKAQLMTDAKSREAQMKSLNRPLDALFDELKQRLESLPTAEQRMKASAGEKGKK